ncbi:unnamed protein product [Prorocentrum cordatum]|uniref:C2 domain-containing protein n=1 Tax=Prorocentrum cordatum TaxID=2364126 RepID=A0ABN9V7X8_9DINO|nr:unnamed protein product [Polarella glacialis]|mmetsp:Transcript_90312/g.235108  ORF Transcript_90312/g.235108 Transcript_90312/m.235108 type:complete len:456 (-) Transcript_90312:65-1432(-)
MSGERRMTGAVGRVRGTRSYRISAHDRRQLSSSYGVHEELDRLIFGPDSVEEATQNLFKRYKDQANLPSRVRVRIYLMKAVCIFSEKLVNPFLSLRLGQDADQARLKPRGGEGQQNHSMPSFYHVEERDIQLPQQGRLQLDMSHLADGGFDGFVGREQLIGSTVVDLEDRWHSANLTQATLRKRVPVEHRPLIGSGAAGKNGGSLEMRIEMLDSVKASDEPAANLAKPAPTKLEVRFVIRTTTGVRIVDGEHTDVKIVVELECDEYLADQSLYPKSQATDTHHNSRTGDAIFNWRVVFPQIAMPTTGCNVHFKVYDSNSIVGDTFIGEVVIDIRRHLSKVSRDLDMLVIEKGELAFKDGRSIGGDAKDEVGDVGKVQFEMHVLTQSEAAQKLAGVGREEPNCYPQLAAPVDGRMWGDVLAPLVWEWPTMGLFGRVAPLIVFGLLCLMFFRWLDLV